jgi:hypothetical protein
MKRDRIRYKGRRPERHRLIPARARRQVSGRGVTSDLRFATCGAPSRRWPSRRRDRRPGVARFDECRKGVTGGCRTHQETRNFRKHVSALSAAQTCNARTAGGSRALAPAAGPRTRLWRIAGRSTRDGRDPRSARCGTSAIEEWSSDRRHGPGLSRSSKPAEISGVTEAPARRRLPLEIALAAGTGGFVETGARQLPHVVPTQKPPRLRDGPRLRPSSGSGFVRVDGEGRSVNTGTHTRPPVRAAWPAAASSL